MSRSTLLIQNAGPDNPWRRLPWLMLVSVLIWVTLLCGFGMLLDHMAVKPEQLMAIDAQLIEMPMPDTHAAVQKLTQSEPLHQLAEQPPRHLQSAVQPETQTPAVSLPTATLPANIKAP